MGNAVTQIENISNLQLVINTGTDIHLLKLPILNMKLFKMLTEKKI